MPNQDRVDQRGYYNRNDPAALFFLLQKTGRKTAKWQRQKRTKDRKKEEDAGRLLYVVVIPWPGEEDRTQ